MLELLRLINQLNVAPNLCNIMQLLAYDTWKRIQFTRTRAKKGFKIFETTITQNIIYDLRLLCELFPYLNIRMYEAIDEKTNGNDIELIVKTREGFIVVPVQAKILYKDFKYKAMDHNEQIDKLINYANLWKGLPLYLLYNYYPYDLELNNQQFCSLQYSQEQYGCSLICADYLLKNYTKCINGVSSWCRVPHYTDLHPSKAIPWFVLGCCEIENSSISDTISYLCNSNISNRVVKGYALTELKNDDYWKNLDLDAKTPDLNNTSRVEENIFRPKFRIIFHNEV